MPTLLKRLSANELGQAGGHQRGGILIPKRCVTFFPQLPADTQNNPEMTLSLVTAEGEVLVRFIHYRTRTRNEHRVTPIPHAALSNASQGDICAFREIETGRYSFHVFHAGAAETTALDQLLGSSRGRVVDDSEIPDFISLAAPPASGDDTLEGNAGRGGGQGFSTDAEQRRLIEKAAMQAATQHYEEQGYTVEDQSASQPYDLFCMKDGESLFVEVKGTTGEGNQIVLTRGEVMYARANQARMHLFIRSGIVIRDGIATGGSDRILPNWAPEGDRLEPISFFYSVPEP